MGLVVAELGDLPQAPRAQGSQVHGRRGGHQGLRRADVGRGPLPANVLLSRLQRQHEARPSLRVHRAPHDAAGHLPEVLLATGEETHVGAAEAQRRPQRLALARHDVGAELSGRRQHPQGDRVDRHHQQGVGVVGRTPVRLQALHRSQEVRVLDQQAGGCSVHARRPRRHDVEGDALGLAVGADPPLGSEGLPSPARPRRSGR